jgi:hypothetical protein
MELNAKNLKLKANIISYKFHNIQYNIYNLKSVKQEKQTKT